MILKDGWKLVHSIEQTEPEPFSKLRWRFISLDRELGEKGHLAQAELGTARGLFRDSESAVGGDRSEGESPFLC